MKLQAEIGDDKHQVEIHRNGDIVTATIDGETFEAEVSQPEPNVYLIKRDGKVFEAFVVLNDRPTQATAVSVNGHDVDVKLIDPKRLRSKGSDTEHGDGLAEIRTAMPGKVVRLLVEVGAAVEKGDGVLVVEAMKMQNELKSPKAGTVKTIKVSEGHTVAGGDVLATIE